MYTYKAAVENVVDGDTLDLTIDLGFKMTTRQRVRLAHVDTPERGQPGFKEAGDAVRAMAAGQTVTVRTQKISKWGYYLANIELADGTDVSAALIKQGLAKAYEGGTKA